MSDHEHTKTDGLGDPAPLGAGSAGPALLPAAAGADPWRSRPRNERMAAGKIECNACPVLCQIGDGKVGACDRYANAGGVLVRVDPVLLVRKAGAWHERGVEVQGGALAWLDRPTELRPPMEPQGAHDYLTEIHPQAEAFIRTLADRLVQGAAFFIDYGFAESEYYHPQRHMGTLMCHQGHLADADPLVDVGRKDITAHVNFTGLALAAQQAGLPTLGYTTQARFLMNCGLVPLLAQAALPDRVAGQRLIAEHEMGELFKVIGFHRGEFWDAAGFREGDRTHTL